MSNLESTIQAPDCEMLTVRERFRDAVSRYAARYIMYKVAQIIPESACGGPIGWEAIPDYAGRGIEELEQFANFPQIEE